MKPHCIAVAVAAALVCPIASAVNVSPTGMGEVLFYPYYTVQAGQKTLFSIVNATDRTKIVKVRFLEAKNTRDVLDFHLFMSPFDVWVASVQPDPEPCGGNFGEGTEPCADEEIPANLFTPDQSCTFGDVFALGTSGKDFVNFNYTAEFDDNAGGALSRTREGYLTVFEMGEIDTSTDTGQLLADAVNHLTGDGVDCEVIRDAYITSPVDEDTGVGVWNPFAGGDPEDYVTEPTGGLYGAWEILQVQEGQSIGGEAIALQHFYDPEGFSQTSEHSLHFFPGGFNPNLNDGDQGNDRHIARLLNDSESVGGGAVLLWQAEFFESADAVSAVFMHNRLWNEYTINANVGAATDWLVLFPTKVWYTDARPTAGFGTRAPFTAGGFTHGLEPGRACERIRSEQWNREEEVGSRTTDGFSPPIPAGGFRLCWEANVITMGTTESVLGSELVKTEYPISNAFRNGHVRFELGLTEDASGFAPFIRALDSNIPIGGTLSRFFGLPAIGFSAFNRTNENVGVGASYGTSFNHRYTRCMISGTGLFDTEQPLERPEFCQ